MHKILRAHLFLFLITHCLGGCVSPWKTLKDDVYNASSSVQIGMLREEVVAILGSPIVSSKSLGIELFQVRGQDTDLHLFLAVPIPIPGEYVTVSILVEYDELEQVTAVHDGYVADVYASHANVGLVSEEFDLAETSRKQPGSLILHGPRAEAVFNREATQVGCTLNLLFERGPLGRLYVDDRELASFDPFMLQHWMKLSFIHFEDSDPSEAEQSSWMTTQTGGAWNRYTYRWMNTFLALSLEPGMHTVSIYLNDSTVPLNQEFDCRDGQRLVVSISAEYADILNRDLLSGWEWKTGGRIQMTDMTLLPPGVSGKRQILTDTDGVWLGLPEQR